MINSGNTCTSRHSIHTCLTAKGKNMIRQVRPKKLTFAVPSLEAKPHIPDIFSAETYHASLPTDAPHSSSVHSYSLGRSGRKPGCFQLHIIKEFKISWWKYLKCCFGNTRVANFSGTHILITSCDCTLSDLENPLQKQSDVSPTKRQALAESGGESRQCSQSIQVTETSKFLNPRWFFSEISSFINKNHRL